MNARTRGTSQAIGTDRPMALGLVASAAAAMLVWAGAQAADPAGGAPSAKSPQVTFEAIAGSTVKRITLTAKAAERLGIATDKVSEQTVVRRQMVGGLVVPPMDVQAAPTGGAGGAKGEVFGKAAPTAAPAAATAAPGARLPGVGFGGFAAGGAAPAPAALKTIAAPMAPPVPAPSPSGDVRVLVNLSAAEWERTAKDKPVRLLALGTRDPQQGELLAQPSGAAPTEDPKRSMLSVYYVVPGKNHGLVVNNRMRVEIPMVGVEDKQKVVPYSAVYYDGKGTPWVYVSPKPLTYERQRVVVERVAGDLAVLADGPEVGATIVSIGAALLFGTEIYGK